MITSDGQVVLIRFPQTDQRTGKLRPALAIRRLPGRHGDWLIAMITSKLAQRVSVDEIIREADRDFAESGLKKTSLVRVTRLAAVDQKLVVGAIGQISGERIASVKRRIGQRSAEPST